MGSKFLLEPLWHNYYLFNEIALKEISNIKFIFIYEGKISMGLYKYSTESAALPSHLNATLQFHGRVTQNCSLEQCLAYQCWQSR